MCGSDVKTTAPPINVVLVSIFPTKNAKTSVPLSATLVAESAPALATKKLNADRRSAFGLGIRSALLSVYGRLDFITLLGGAATWPLAARAQQGKRVRRIGLLSNGTAESPVEQARQAAFLTGLGQLGWTAGRNVRIDTLWSAGDPERIRRNVAEMVALAPDVILSSGGTVAVAALQRAAQSVPIVFTILVDPVGSGLMNMA